MKEMISKIKIIGILSYTFYMIYSFMALWLFFEFIGHVSTHEFNILLSIKLFLMMGVTFTVGIVFNNIIENKKTNSLILSVAIIMGLVLNPNIVVTAYSITYNYVSSIIKSGNEYSGQYSGNWEGYLFNQYNTGSASFSVSDDGSAKLSLRGKFRAVYNGYISGDYFVINSNNEKCRIVDMGDGSFKVALIWTGVNVDVFFR